MRKIKSILAMFVGFWLWQAVRLFFPDLELHPIYIYFYGMLEIRNTSEKTAELGPRRLKATATGMAIALIMIPLMQLIKSFVSVSWANAAIELTFVLVGCLLTLIVAEVVGCKTSTGIAALICIGMLVNHAGGGRYLYCLLRVAQTVTGVLLAWLINVKIFPFHGKPKTPTPAAN